MSDKLRKVKIPSAHRELLDALSLDGETWAPHPDYPSFYASSQGRVASIAIRDTRANLLKFGKKLELTRGTIGKNYMRKQFLPHRFVWECFYGKITDTRQIVFKDGDSTNLRLTNLELVPPAKRIQLQGLTKPTPSQV